MFSLLLQKELKNIITSPKFTATFLVCSLLILISFFIGINEYENAVAQYQANQEIARQNIAEATSWGRVQNLLHREPNPVQIFVSGVHFDVGRLSNISDYNDVKLVRSPYSDETLFAIFRVIDFAFIVQIVLSLFAILFTYDAINGEREQGTLKLAFVNSISRAKYLIAKFCGIWLGLIVPLLIPILLGMLMLIAFKVPLASADWLSIISLVGLSVLYISLFIVIGILVSSITRSSSLSFLLLLVIWISGVLIVPRLGVMAAGQIVQVESVAQIEAKQEAFQKARWDDYSAELTEVWQEREAQMDGMSDEERTAYRDEMEWTWLEEDDASRKQVQSDIITNNRRLLEESQNRKKLQEQLAFNIARISPVASFQLAAMKLARTDVGLKNRYETSMRLYKDDFSEYIQQKEAEEGGHGGFNISIDSEQGVQIDFGRNDQTLDTSEMPQYQSPELRIQDTLGAALFDFGFLGICIVLGFGGSVLAFMRYDLR